MGIDSVMTRLTRALLIAALVSQVACGTLLYPERRSQKPTGRVDYGVVLMDAAWMLVFLVPGIAAIVVDFATGAIYLPDGRKQFYQSEGTRKSTALVLRPGVPVTIHAPGGLSEETTWDFDIHRTGDPTPLASWTWTMGSDFSIDVPESLAAGTYELRVARNEIPVGHLAVHVEATRRRTAGNVGSD